MLHTYSVLVTLPAAPSHKAEQRVTVRAGGWPTAARRGLCAVLARDGLRGRRHEEVKVSIIRTA